MKFSKRKSCLRFFNWVIRKLIKKDLRWRRFIIYLNIKAHYQKLRQVRLPQDRVKKAVHLSQQVIEREHFCQYLNVFLHCGFFGFC